MRTGRQYTFQRKQQEQKPYNERKWVKQAGGGGAQRARGRNTCDEAGRLAWAEYRTGSHWLVLSKEAEVS